MNHELVITANGSDGDPDEHVVLTIDGAEVFRLYRDEAENWPVIMRAVGLAVRNTAIHFDEVMTALRVEVTT